MVKELLIYYRATYESSDDTVVSVDENGAVTAIGTGAAIVSASVNWDVLTKAYIIPYAMK